MLFAINAFSQRGKYKPKNEDALRLNGKVYQGSVREQYEVGTTEPCYFVIADGVSSGTLPRMASRRLLELLQMRLADV